MAPLFTSIVHLGQQGHSCLDLDQQSYPHQKNACSNLISIKNMPVLIIKDDFYLALIS
jgi:hypothetical protein